MKTMIKPAQDQVRVGDVWEGVGGMKVRVRIESIGERTAEVVLVRSGTRKQLQLATLRKAYRLLGRVVVQP